MKRRQLLRMIVCGPAGLAGLAAAVLGCTRRRTTQHVTAQDRYRKPQQVVAALGLRPGAQVAEIGAGGGYLTRYLAQAVGPQGRVVATDIDAEALATLAARCRQEGLSQVVPRQVTPTDPGLEAAAFDLIVLAYVDHLLPDRAAYLRRILPALRPAGRIALSNREDQRSAVLTAATAAGLHSQEIGTVDLPGQFLLLLRAD
jgi:tRNA A58 N-methylase Trm61